ncbi:hypothetical protein RCL1_007039 [Eukaryota sp. TZLM3-RCL]
MFIVWLLLLLQLSLTVNAGVFQYASCSSGSWNDPSSWTSGHVPSPSAAVEFPPCSSPYIVEVSSSIQLRSLLVHENLRLSSSTPEVGLSITQDLFWRGGTIDLLIDLSLGASFTLVSETKPLTIGESGSLNVRGDFVLLSDRIHLIIKGSFYAHPAARLVGQRLILEVSSPSALAKFYALHLQTLLSVESVTLNSGILELDLQTPDLFQLNELVINPNAKLVLPLDSSNLVVSQSFLLNGGELSGAGTLTLAQEANANFPSNAELKVSDNFVFFIDGTFNYLGSLLILENASFIVSSLGKMSIESTTDIITTSTGLFEYSGSSDLVVSENSLVKFKVHTVVQSNLIVSSGIASFDSAIFQGSVNVELNSTIQFTQNSTFDASSIVSGDGGIVLKEGVVVTVLGKFLLSGKVSLESSAKLVFGPGSESTSLTIDPLPEGALIVVSSGAIFALESSSIELFGGKFVLESSANIQGRGLSLISNHPNSTFEMGDVTVTEEEFIFSSLLISAGTFIFKSSSEKVYFDQIILQGTGVFEIPELSCTAKVNNFDWQNGLVSGLGTLEIIEKAVSPVSSLCTLGKDTVISVTGIWEIFDSNIQQSENSAIIVKDNGQLLLFGTVSFNQFDDSALIDYSSQFPLTINSEQIFIHSNFILHSSLIVESGDLHLFKSDVRGSLNLNSLDSKLYFHEEFSLTSLATLTGKGELFLNENSDVHIFGIWSFSGLLSLNPFSNLFLESGSQVSHLNLSPVPENSTVHFKSGSLTIFGNSVLKFSGGNLVVEPNAILTGTISLLEVSDSSSFILFYFTVVNRQTNYLLVISSLLVSQGTASFHVTTQNTIRIQQVTLKDFGNLHLPLVQSRMEIREQLNIYTASISGVGNLITQKDCIFTCHAEHFPVIGNGTRLSVEGLMVVNSPVLFFRAEALLAASNNVEILHDCVFDYDSNYPSPLFRIQSHNSHFSVKNGAELLIRIPAELFADVVVEDGHLRFSQASLSKDLTINSNGNVYLQGQVSISRASTIRGEGNLFLLPSSVLTTRGVYLLSGPLTLYPDGRLRFDKDAKISEFNLQPLPPTALVEFLADSLFDPSVASFNLAGGHVTFHSKAEVRAPDVVVFSTHNDSVFRINDVTIGNNRRFDFSFVSLQGGSFIDNCVSNRKSINNVLLGVGGNYVVPETNSVSQVTGILQWFGGLISGLGTVIATGSMSTLPLTTSILGTSTTLEVRLPWTFDDTTILLYPRSSLLVSSGGSIKFYGDNCVVDAIPHSNPGVFTYNSNLVFDFNTTANIEFLANTVINSLMHVSNGLLSFYTVSLQHNITVNTPGSIVFNRPSSLARFQVLSGSGSIVLKSGTIFSVFGSLSLEDFLTIESGAKLFYAQHSISSQLRINPLPEGAEVEVQAGATFNFDDAIIDLNGGIFRLIPNCIIRGVISEIKLTHPSSNFNIGALLIPLNSLITIKKVTAIQGTFTSFIHQNQLERFVVEEFDLSQDGIIHVPATGRGIQVSKTFTFDGGLIYGLGTFWALRSCHTVVPEGATPRIGQNTRLSIEGDLDIYGNSLTFNQESLLAVTGKMTIHSSCTFLTSPPGVSAQFRYSTADHALAVSNDAEVVFYVETYLLSQFIVDSGIARFYSVSFGTDVEINSNGELHLYSSVEIVSAAKILGTGNLYLHTGTSATIRGTFEVFGQTILKPNAHVVFTGTSKTLAINLSPVPESSSVRVLRDAQFEIHQATLSLDGGNFTLLTGSVITGSEISVIISHPSSVFEVQDVVVGTSPFGSLVFESVLITSGTFRDASTSDRFIIENLELLCDGILNVPNRESRSFISREFNWSGKITGLGRVFTLPEAKLITLDLCTPTIGHDTSLIVQENSDWKVASREILLLSRSVVEIQGTLEFESSVVFNHEASLPPALFKYTGNTPFDVSNCDLTFIVRTDISSDFSISFAHARFYDATFGGNVHLGPQSTVELFSSCVFGLGSKLTGEGNLIIREGVTVLIQGIMDISGVITLHENASLQLSAGAQFNSGTFSPLPLGSSVQVMYGADISLVGFSIILEGGSVIIHSSAFVSGNNVDIIIDHPNSVFEIGTPSVLDDNEFLINSLIINDGTFRNSNPRGVVVDTIEFTSNNAVIDLPTGDASLALKNTFTFHYGKIIGFGELVVLPNAELIIPENSLIDMIRTRIAVSGLFSITDSTIVGVSAMVSILPEGTTDFSGNVFFNCSSAIPSRFRFTGYNFIIHPSSSVYMGWQLDLNSNLTLSQGNLIITKPSIFSAHLTLLQGASVQVNEAIFSETSALIGDGSLRCTNFVSFAGIFLGTLDLGNSCTFTAIEGAKVESINLLPLLPGSSFIYSSGATSSGRHQYVIAGGNFVANPGSSLAALMNLTINHPSSRVVFDNVAFGLNELTFDHLLLNTGTLIIRQVPPVEVSANFVFLSCSDLPPVLEIGQHTILYVRNALDLPCGTIRGPGTIQSLADSSIKISTRNSKQFLNSLNLIVGGEIEFDIDNSVINGGPGIIFRTLPGSSFSIISPAKFSTTVVGNNIPKIIPYDPFIVSFDDITASLVMEWRLESNGPITVDRARFDVRGGGYCRSDVTVNSGSQLNFLASTFTLHGSPDGTSPGSSLLGDGSVSLDEEAVVRCNGYFSLTGDLKVFSGSTLLFGSGGVAANFNMEPLEGSIIFSAESEFIPTHFNFSILNGQFICQDDAILHLQETFIYQRGKDSVLSFGANTIKHNLYTPLIDLADGLIELDIEFPTYCKHLILHSLQDNLPQIQLLDSNELILYGRFDWKSGGVGGSGSVSLESSSTCFVSTSSQKRLFASAGIVVLGQLEFLDDTDIYAEIGCFFQTTPGVDLNINKKVNFISDTGQMSSFQPRFNNMGVLNINENVYISFEFYNYYHVFIAPEKTLTLDNSVENRELFSVGQNAILAAGGSFLNPRGSLIDGDGKFEIFSKASVLLQSVFSLKGGIIAKHGIFTFAPSSTATFFHLLQCDAGASVIFDSSSRSTPSSSTIKVTGGQFTALRGAQFSPTLITFEQTSGASRFEFNSNQNQLSFSSVVMSGGSLLLDTESDVIFRNLQLSQGSIFGSSLIRLWLNSKWTSGSIANPLFLRNQDVLEISSTGPHTFSGPTLENNGKIRLINNPKLSITFNSIITNKNEIFAQNSEIRMFNDSKIINLKDFYMDDFKLDSVLNPRSFYGTLYNTQTGNLFMKNNVEFTQFVKVVFARDSTVDCDSCSFYLGAVLDDEISGDFHLITSSSYLYVCSNNAVFGPYSLLRGLGHLRTCANSQTIITGRYELNSDIVCQGGSLEFNSASIKAISSVYLQDCQLKIQKTLFDHCKYDLTFMNLLSSSFDLIDTDVSFQTDSSSSTSSFKFFSNSGCKTEPFTYNSINFENSSTIFDPLNTGLTVNSAILTTSIWTISAPESLISFEFNTLELNSYSVFNISETIVSCSFENLILNEWYNHFGIIDGGNVNIKNFNVNFGYQIVEFFNLAESLKIENLNLEHEQVEFLIHGITGNVQFTSVILEHSTVTVDTVGGSLNIPRMILDWHASLTISFVAGPIVSSDFWILKDWSCVFLTQIDSLSLDTLIVNGTSFDLSRPVVHNFPAKFSINHVTQSILIGNLYVHHYSTVEIFDSQSIIFGLVSVDYQFGSSYLQISQTNSLIITDEFLLSGVFSVDSVGAVTFAKSTIFARGSLSMNQILSFTVDILSLNGPASNVNISNCLTGLSFGLIDADSSSIILSDIGDSLQSTNILLKNSSLLAKRIGGLYVSENFLLSGSSFGVFRSIFGDFAASLLTVDSVSRVDADLISGYFSATTVDLSQKATVDIGQIGEYFNVTSTFTASDDSKFSTQIIGSDSKISTLVLNNFAKFFVDFIGSNSMQQVSLLTDFSNYTVKYIGQNSDWNQVELTKNSYWYVHHVDENLNCFKVSQNLNTNLTVQNIGGSSIITTFDSHGNNVFSIQSIGLSLTSDRFNLTGMSVFSSINVGQSVLIDSITLSDQSRIFMTNIGANFVSSIISCESASNILFNSIAADFTVDHVRLLGISKVVGSTVGGSMFGDIFGIMGGSSMNINNIDKDFSVSTVFTNSTGSVKFDTVDNVEITSLTAQNSSKVELTSIKGDVQIINFWVSDYASVSSFSSKSVTIDFARLFNQSNVNFGSVANQIILIDCQLFSTSILSLSSGISFYSDLLFLHGTSRINVDQIASTFTVNNLATYNQSNLIGSSVHTILVEDSIHSAASSTRFTTVDSVTWQHVSTVSSLPLATSMLQLSTVAKSVNFNTVDLVAGIIRINSVLGNVKSTVFDGKGGQLLATSVTGNVEIEQNFNTRSTVFTVNSANEVLLPNIDLFSDSRVSISNSYITMSVPIFIDDTSRFSLSNSRTCHFTNISLGGEFSNSGLVYLDDLNWWSRGLSGGGKFFAKTTSLVDRSNHFILANTELIVEKDLDIFISTTILGGNNAIVRSVSTTNVHGKLEMRTTSTSNRPKLIIENDLIFTWSAHDHLIQWTLETLPNSHVFCPNASVALAGGASVLGKWTAPGALHHPSFWPFDPVLVDSMEIISNCTEHGACISKSSKVLPSVCNEELVVLEEIQCNGDEMVTLDPDLVDILCLSLDSDAFICNTTLGYDFSCWDLEYSMPQFYNSCSSQSYWLPEQEECFLFSETSGFYSTFSEVCTTVFDLFDQILIDCDVEELVDEHLISTICSEVSGLAPLCSKPVDEISCREAVASFRHWDAKCMHSEVSVTLEPHCLVES